MSPHLPPGRTFAVDGEVRGMGPGWGKRLRATALATGVVAGLVVPAAAWQAGTDPAPAGAQETPPTTAPDLLQELLNQLFPTTTVPAPVPAPPPAEAPAPHPAAGAPTPPPAPFPQKPDQPYAPVPVDPRPFRGPGRNNNELMAMLPLLEAIGFNPTEAIVAGMGKFPVGGPAAYTDGFLEPRPGHLHQGVDINAAQGTPVRAPGDGIVRYSEEGGYGKVAAVTVADGTTWFMSHLDTFMPGLASGSAVKQGQFVGAVGMTGNATGPHVHLELRGPGGVSDPKPVLDRALDEAVAAIPGIITSFKGLEASLPRAIAFTGQLRRFDERPTASAAALDALAWAASVDPGPGIVPRAEQRAREVTLIVENDPDVSTRPASTESWRRARDLARAMVAPVTPGILHEAMAAPTAGGD